MIDLLARLKTVLGYDAAQPTTSAVLEDVARPIAGANPCGEDVTYDPEFERLKEEVDKLNSVDIRVDQEKAASLAQDLKPVGKSSANVPAAIEAKPIPTSASRAGMDVELVVALSRSILSQKSKDLRVAWYLALGLAKRDGVAGLAEGAAAVTVLVQTYWDGLYPPLGRMAARSGAIKTGIGWISDVFASAPKGVRDRAVLERLRSAVGELERALTSRELKAEATLVGKLEQTVKDALAHLPTRDENVVPVTPLGDQRNGSESASAGQPPVAPSELIARAAAALRKENRSRPAPYRLVRVQRWDALLAEPVNDRKKTKIEAPPQPRRAFLINLHKSANWDSLLDEGESSFALHPFHFWLDLQRLLVAALNGLGNEFAAVREAVEWEARRLTERLPTLATLTFADGTRFADAATAAWLAGLATTPSGGAGHSDPQRADGASDSMEARFAEAKKRFAGGDLAGALSQLQRGAGEDLSQHDRFQRRLLAATMCADAGQLGVARGILEELDQSVELHRLESWEPALALHVWTRLHECYGSLAARTTRGVDTQQIARDRERVFNKICRVDVAKALTMAQEVGRPA